MFTTGGQCHLEVSEGRWPWKGQGWGYDLDWWEYKATGQYTWAAGTDIHSTGQISWGMQYGMLLHVC